MSRVAKSPVPIPKGIEVQLQDTEILVKGDKGSLSHQIHPNVSIKMDDGKLVFISQGNTKSAVALAGTTRAIINNMVHGISRGFEKKLTLVGVGYRAQVKGRSLNLTLGYSHPIDYPIPENVTIETPSQTEIVIKGIDKQLIGQVAANIRRYRSPEPYKGKGIRYSDEVIVLKETKKK